MMFLVVYEFVKDNNIFKLVSDLKTLLNKNKNVQVTFADDMTYEGHDESDPRYIEVNFYATPKEEVRGVCAHPQMDVQELADLCKQEYKERHEKNIRELDCL